MCIKNSSSHLVLYFISTVKEKVGGMRFVPKRQQFNWKKKKYIKIDGSFMAIFRESQFCARDEIVGVSFTSFEKKGMILK